MSLLKLDYFRGSMYFNDREHLTGFHYELFVANYFVRSRGCVVIHQGKILGKEDNGIDLIAISRETTYLIQCKCWLSPLSTDVFTSVKGSAELVTQLCHLPGEITPVVASGSGFYRDALETSNILGVEALYLPITDNHALHDNLLSNYIDELPVEAYHQRVPDIFEAVHSNFYLVDVDAAAERELEKSENQKLQKPDQATPETDSATTNKIENPHCNSASLVSPEERAAVERGFLYYLLFFNSKANNDTNVFMSLLKSIGIIVAIIIGLSIACIPLVGLPLLISVAAIIIWVKSD